MFPLRLIRSAHARVARGCCQCLPPGLVPFVVTPGVGRWLCGGPHRFRAAGSAHEVIRGLRFSLGFLAVPLVGTCQRCSNADGFSSIRGSGYPSSLAACAGDAVENVVRLPASWPGCFLSLGRLQFDLPEFLAHPISGLPLQYRCLPFTGSWKSGSLLFCACQLGSVYTSGWPSVHLRSFGGDLRTVRVPHTPPLDTHLIIWTL